VLELIEDRRRPQEIGFRAPALGQRPVEVRLDRRGQLIDIAAVEAQPGLEPQAVARAEPGRQHVGVAEQHLRQRLGLLLAHRDLETVLAGVAGPADPDRNAANIHLRDAHEGERGRRRAHRLHQRAGRGPLQRQQGAPRMLLQRHVGRQVLGQIVRIEVFAARIAHHDEPVAVIGHHDVVDDPARFVQQQRVALPARFEALDVAGDDEFERPGGVGAMQAELAHMRDVEQRGFVTALLVLGDQTVSVLDRHPIAGEGHHLGAETAMQRVERDRAQVFRLVGFDVQDRLGQRSLPQRSTCQLTLAGMTPLCPGT
jgi:hypothetical protein